MEAHLFPNMDCDIFVATVTLCITLLLLIYNGVRMLSAHK